MTIALRTDCCNPSRDVAFCSSIGYPAVVSKRTGRQGPEDTNEAAFRVVQSMISNTEGLEEPELEKDLSAVRAEAGRKGGLKGGQARASKLTPEQRSEIAKKAAAKRWQNGSK
jgi:hypothetical protein